MVARFRNMSRNGARRHQGGNGGCPGSARVCPATDGQRALPVRPRLLVPGVRQISAFGACVDDHVDMTVSAAHASAFFSEAATYGAVFAIRDADGFPAPVNGDGERAMPFWSRRSRATRIIDAVPAYAGFEVVGLPMAEFTSRWLPGLERDGLQVGLNWSGPEATGYDTSPSDVASRLHASW